MTRVQRQIAEDCLCLETSANVSVVANTETYAFPTGMITERMLIVSGTTQGLEKINMDRVNELKQLGASVTSTTSTLLYYYKWGNLFGFLTAAGGAPTAAVTVTVYYWRYPNSTAYPTAGAELIGTNVDPVIDTRWNTALFYGTVFDITADVKWLQLYQSELDRVRSREMMTRDETFQIPTNRDYD